MLAWCSCEHLEVWTGGNAFYEVVELRGFFRVATTGPCKPGSSGHSEGIAVPASFSANQAVFGVALEAAAAEAWLGPGDELERFESPGACYGVSPVDVLVDDPEPEVGLWGCWWLEGDDLVD